MEARQWQDPPEYRGGGMNFAMPTLTPVVKMLLIANVAMFLLTFIARFPDSMDGGVVYSTVHDFLALTPELWKAWFPLVPVWQLLTYGFLHGGVSHILMNMLFLYFLGTMLEGIVGGRRFLVFYVAAVVLSGFIQLMMSLTFGPATSILGASGGVLAVVCAVATLRPTTRIIFILFPLTLKTLALIIVAMDVLRVISEAKGTYTGVASYCHLTGAALGYLAVRQGWIWHDPLAKLEQVRERRVEENESSDRQELDALLDRIHREGIGSLSAREKAFLKRMSKSG